MTERIFEEGSADVDLEEAKAFTSDSALMIAYERMLETDRGESALVNDPFARQLAGEKGPALSAEFGQAFPYFGFKDWPEFHQTWTVVRSKFIDDTINSLATEGCGLQLVNMGAGMDTRALRLDSYRRLSASYEVDLEAMNKSKAVIFSSLKATPLCRQALISVDLLDSSALASGLAAESFDPSKPSILLAEALIQYLSGEEERFISSFSSIAAPGSTLILQYLDKAGLPSEGPIQSGFTRSELESWLTKGGWSEFCYNIYGDEVLNYGRFKAGEDPNPCFSFVVCKKALAPAP